MYGLIFVIWFAFIGGLLYRVRGGNPPSLPRPIPQLVFCLPLALCLVMVDARPGLVIIGFAAAVLGCATGHGQYMNLGRFAVRPWERETLDSVVALFFGRDKRAPAGPLNPPEGFWRDLAGLGVTGLAMTLAPGAIVALAGHIVPGLALAASGAVLKPLAYWAGWAAFAARGPRFFPALKSGVEAGEWLYGAGLYAAAAWVIRAVQ